MKKLLPFVEAWIKKRKMADLKDGKPERKKMDKQLRYFMVKQRKLIMEAKNEEEMAKLIGFAVGFLNGMRISKTITREQYEAEYAKLKDLAELRKAVCA